MTVRELINLLQEQNLDGFVYVDSPEGDKSYFVNKISDGNNGDTFIEISE